MSPDEATRTGVVSGVRWVAIGQVAGELLRFLVSITLARLLAPDDFGLLAMAAVLSQFVRVFHFMGIGAAIIQRPRLSNELLNALVTVGLVSGALMTLSVVAAAPALALYFEDSRVTAVAAVSALGFLVSSFGLVPESVMQRELRFGRIVLIELVAQVIRAVAALILAYGGWGVWALVISGLIEASVKSLLMVVASPVPVRAGWNFGEIRGLIGFSSGVIGFNITNYFSRNADNLIVGRALGAQALGFYSYAYQIYMYPLLSITNVLMRVMFPALSRLQDDNERLGRVFVRANSAIAIITFPMMAGLASIADVFVDAVLGEKWYPIIALIMVLSPAGMLQSLAGTPGQLMLAKGRAGLRFWWSVIYSVLIVISFFCGIPWGIVGVASAYTIVFAPISYVAFRIALGLIDYPMRELWRALTFPTLASAGMFVVVFSLKTLLRSAAVSSWTCLFTCVPLGVILYVVALVILRPAALVDVLMIAPEPIRRLRPVASLLSR